MEEKNTTIVICNDTFLRLQEYLDRRFAELEEDDLADVYDLEKLIRLKNALSNNAIFDLDSLCTIKMPDDDYKDLAELMIIDGSFYYKHLDMLKKFAD